MASTKAMMIFFVMMNLSGALMAAHEYKVGDSAGWTTNIDYRKWVSGKEFHVGDTIVFLYNNSYHNVKEVTYQNFKSCNATSAIAAYSSGYDNITLKRPGDHFFLCGIVGHCQSGQKLAIRVFRSSTMNTQTSKPETSSTAKASSPLSTLSSGPTIAPANTAAFYSSPSNV